MKPRILMVLTLLLAAPVLSGCTAAALGAGGVIAADKVAENEGSNLF